MNNVFTRIIRKLGIAVRVEPQHLYSNYEITLADPLVRRQIVSPVWHVSIRDTYTAGFEGLEQ